MGVAASVATGEGGGHHLRSGALDRKRLSPSSSLKQILTRAGSSFHRRSKELSDSDGPGNGRNQRESMSSTESMTAASDDNRRSSVAQRRASSLMNGRVKAGSDADIRLPGDANYTGSDRAELIKRRQSAMRGWRTENDGKSFHRSATTIQEIALRHAISHSRRPSLADSVAPSTVWNARGDDMPIVMPIEPSFSIMPVRAARAIHQRVLHQTSILEDEDNIEEKEEHSRANLAWLDRGSPANSLHSCRSSNSSQSRSSEAFRTRDLSNASEQSGSRVGRHTIAVSSPRSQMLISHEQGSGEGRRHTISSAKGLPPLGLLPSLRPPKLTLTFPPPATAKPQLVSLAEISREGSCVGSETPQGEIMGAEIKVGVRSVVPATSGGGEQDLQALSLAHPKHKQIQQYKRRNLSSLNDDEWVSVDDSELKEITPRERVEGAITGLGSYQFTKSGTILLDGFNGTIRDSGLGGRVEQVMIPMQQRLVLLDELGRGASGIVYKAFDLVDLRLVAIKSMPVNDKGKRRQMVQELTALYESLHGESAEGIGSAKGRAALVDFYDAFASKEDATVSLMVEYMDGGSLQVRFPHTFLFFRNILCLLPPSYLGALSLAYRT
jgi:hypothetical protein